MAKPKDYDIGYARPPRHSQFKPGQSGNPKGRPKGSRSVAATLAAGLNQRVWVIENGRRRSVTKLEAMVTQLVNKAAAADLTAMKLLLNLQAIVEKEAEGLPESREELAPDDEKLMQQLLERMKGMQGEGNDA